MSLLAWRTDEDVQRILTKHLRGFAPKLIEWIVAGVCDRDGATWKAAATDAFRQIPAATELQ